MNVGRLMAPYGVFYSAGTDLGFELVVRDTVSGATKRYSNSSGNLAAPVGRPGGDPLSVGSAGRPVSRTG